MFYYGYQYGAPEFVVAMKTISQKSFVPRVFVPQRHQWRNSMYSIQQTPLRNYILSNQVFIFYFSA